MIASLLNRLPLLSGEIPHRLVEKHTENGRKALLDNPYVKKKPTSLTDSDMCPTLVIIVTLDGSFIPKMIGSFTRGFLGWVVFGC